EGVIESGTAVDQLIVPVALIPQQDVEIGGAQPRRNIGLARLEPHCLCIFTWHEEEHEPVEIGQVIACTVRLPIKGVPLERDLLPRLMFLEAKWPQAGECLRGRSQSPGLRQTALFISRLE